MAGNPGATTMGNTGFDVGFCERKRLAGHADECQQIGVERTNADDAFWVGHDRCCRKSRFVNELSVSSDPAMMQPMHIAPRDRRILICAELASDRAENVFNDWVRVTADAARPPRQ